MADYLITAHIKFPTKGAPLRSGAIRMLIPAENGLEAREKAKRFIQHKLSVVIDSCEFKQPDTRSAAQDSFEDVMRKFGSIFGNDS